MITRTSDIAKITITNRGGIADKHTIRLIDASEMYAGLHRAISYCLLSYAESRLVDTVTKNSPIQIYQRRTYDNCISHDIIVGALGGAIGNVLSGAINPVLRVCFQATLGLLTDHEYEQQIKKFKRIEPFFEELTSTIEPHLLRAHSPIHETETINIKLDNKYEMNFDASTKDYLSGSNLSSNIEKFRGSVTRLNVVTGNGRYYAEKLGHIVAFSQPPDFKSRQSARTLSWSLREADRGMPADIEVDAKRYTTNSGRLKRLLIVDTRRI